MANYSLGEIDALARKATRGAGYSWGIAEETGKSVRWLSAYGFSGAEILSQHLLITADKYQNSIPSFAGEDSDILSFENETTESTICALTCCALMNDIAYQIQDGKTLLFKNMLFPLLALSATGRIAEAYDASVSFECGDTNIVCNPDGIALKDTPPLLSDITLSSFESVKRTYAELGTFESKELSSVICKKAENTLQSNNQSTHFPDPQSRKISKQALEVLEKFAHQTYAPATEESRLRGAG